MLQNNCLLNAADNVFILFFFAADGYVSVKNFFIIMFSSVEHKTLETKTQLRSNQQLKTHNFGV